MAKKKDKKEQRAIEPVTNCNQSMEVVENFDHLGKSNFDLSQYEIEKRIHIIRGEQVIIDRDVATLWHNH